MIFSSINHAIDYTADKYGIDPIWFKALIDSESGFKIDAVNPDSGAAGLGQIMPANLKAYGVKNKFDIQENLDVSAKIFKEMLTREKGDYGKAIEGYKGITKKTKAETKKQYLDRFYSKLEKWGGSTVAPAIDYKQDEMSENSDTPELYGKFSLFGNEIDIVKAGFWLLVVILSIFVIWSLTKADFDSKLLTE